MNTNIMVSVCSTTYNHAPYIRQCLDGFLMQQVNFKYEILIHDDASTDGTNEIIKEYAAKYPDIIKPLYEEENQYSTDNPKGMAYWNFSRAKGKYIALCEGDDYWTDPLKLQKQVDFLDNNKDYSMCFHGAEILSHIDNRKGLICDNIGDRDYSANELFQTWIVPTASILFRSECLSYPVKKNNWFLNGDIQLILIASQFGKIRGMSTKMSVYRMHIGGVSYNPLIQEYRCKRYPNHYKAIMINFSNIDQNLIKELLARSYINRAHIQKRIFHILLDYCQAVFYMPKIELLKAFSRYFKR